MSNKLREIDNKIASSQKFFGDLEILDDHRLKKWRASLVTVFVIGFTAAIFWVAANNYGEYSYGQESYVVGVGSARFVDEDGEDLPVVASNVVTTMLVDVEQEEQNENQQINNYPNSVVSVLQEVDKKTAVSGDVLNYTLTIINRGSDELNGLVLFALIPKNVVLDTGSLSGDSYYDKNKGLLMWDLRTLEGVNRVGDEEMINRTYQVIVN